ncbi:SDR family NAD(P)-dependent oxidoreductase [Hoyosella rhizosphaerae]|uniref:Short-chain dehydrogenase n=1 Tax=Hoyosella rhizosphaerae TaxID=1755582 RepID=A0A916X7I1_9ACTN|nr:SDR family NAD(P)-dependent oxidoreductase [Hoyosella rhizosphaerae]MBN4927365.1 SDR family NAD(P)-dependent oxidoreductase [Hoyosella rhizosphaerae]GGC51853.1 short-chain dehydrogenase [Hoyosella rhizosphaerae]
MGFSVKGKTVLVTGAAMGMGRLFAEKAVKEGASQIILWDINGAELEKTAAALTAAGGKVHAQVVDVANLEQIEKSAAEVKEKFGAPHVLINNAGVVRGKLFWEHDNLRDTKFTIDINVLAPMYITRAFINEMIERDEDSRLVTLASAAGTVANPKMSVYAGSKWGVLGWSDSVRLELELEGHKHVKMTTVCPSYINTGMFEGAKGPLMAPILQPQEVVDKSWAGMKSGVPLIFLPKTVLLSKGLKGVLPTRAWDFLAGRVLGVYHSMEEFEGRGNDLSGK